MMKVFDLGKGNKGIIMAYITLLSLVLTSYFFLVSMRLEGYNPEIYLQAYRYFMLFSFACFSLFLPFWKTEGTEREKHLKMLAGVFLFTLSAVPHILMIFTLGKLGGINFVLVLGVQAVWGLSLLCLKNTLGALKLPERWKGFILALFIFSVLVLFPLFLYFFVEYNRTVVTTVFDRRIPPYFFINPMLTAAGLLHVQMGGPVQGGYMPYPICILFWILFSLINVPLSVKFSKGRKPAEVNRDERG